MFKRFKLYCLAAVMLACLSFTKNPQQNLQFIYARSNNMEVDNLGNIYLIKDEELIKYLPNGKFFARYSNLKLGQISHVDVTNPLKLVLYYRDFQQIVFLDNQLSVNSDNVSLEQLGLEQSELVCASANNSFWVYSKQNNELLRFNENSRKIAFTGNLKQVLQTNLTPTFMTEYNGYLFLNCPDNGIYVFDIFGAFSRVIALRGLKHFQVRDERLYYYQDGKLCAYNYKLFDEDCKQPEGATGAYDIKFENKKIYIASPDTVKIINVNEK